MIPFLPVLNIKCWTVATYRLNTKTTVVWFRGEIKVTFSLNFKSQFLAFDDEVGLTRLLFYFMISSDCFVSLHALRLSHVCSSEQFCSIPLIRALCATQESRPLLSVAAARRFPRCYDTAFVLSYISTRVHRWTGITSRRNTCNANGMLSNLLQFNTGDSVRRLDELIFDLQRPWAESVPRLHRHRHWRRSP